MTLHPILALDHVIDGYRDYLQTEFHAKDPFLRLFDAHGFHPAKQVPVAPRDGETPLSDGLLLHQERETRRTPCAP